MSSYQNFPWKKVIVTNNYIAIFKITDIINVVTQEVTSHKS